MNKTPFVATPADAKLVMDPMSEIQLRVGEKEITNMTRTSAIAEDINVPETKKARQYRVKCPGGKIQAQVKGSPIPYLSRACAFFGKSPDAKKTQPITKRCNAIAEDRNVPETKKLLIAKHHREWKNSSSSPFFFGQNSASAASPGFGGSTCSLEAAAVAIRDFPSFSVGKRRQPPLKREGGGRGGWHHPTHQVEL